MADEYVKREALLNEIRMASTLKECVAIVRRFPAADVAPVVHCKDCKHSYVSVDARCCSYGAFYDVAVPDDFFCALAERKDVNEK